MESRRSVYHAGPGQPFQLDLVKGRRFPVDGLRGLEGRVDILEAGRVAGDPMVAGQQGFDAKRTADTVPCFFAALGRAPIYHNGILHPGTD